MAAFPSENVSLSLAQRRTEIVRVVVQSFHHDGGRTQKAACGVDPLEAHLLQRSCEPDRWLFQGEQTSRCFHVCEGNETMKLETKLGPEKGKNETETITAD